MFVVLLYFLAFRVFSIFFGFDFTDAIDYAPLLCLIIGVAGAVCLSRTRHQSATFGLVALMCLLSLWPVLPNFSLFLMARELQSVTGAWPQVMVDDPKNWLGHATPGFDAWFSVTAYLEAFSGAWMIVFWSIFFAAKEKFTVAQRRLFIGLTVIATLFFLFDPGDLYAWWLD